MDREIKEAKMAELVRIRADIARFESTGFTPHALYAKIRELASELLADGEDHGVQK